MFGLQLFTPEARRICDKNTKKLGIPARDREKEFHILTGESILRGSHF